MSERPRRQQAGVHVALLRGVNVGGKNKLLMRDLAALFTAAGCDDVETVIQSGNVVFRARPAVAKRLPDAIGDAILARFGYRVPVVMRSADQIHETVRSNPFLATGADPVTLHVAFLRDLPSAARTAGLDSGRSPPDEFEVRGQDIYLHLPNGIARTRLSNSWFDSMLGTTATFRNWRTVVRLHDLAMGRGRPP